MVELDDWFELTDDWRADLGSLLAPMLYSAGVQPEPG